MIGELDPHNITEVVEGEVLIKGRMVREVLAGAVMEVISTPRRREQQIRAVVAEEVMIICQLSTLVLPVDRVLW
jgi:hypothetical protein